MRRFVQIKNVKRSEAHIDADIGALTRILNAAGIEFVSSYNFTNGKFVVEVESAAASNQVKKLIPPAIQRCDRASTKAAG